MTIHEKRKEELANDFEGWLNNHPELWDRMTGIFEHCMETIARTETEWEYLDGLAIEIKVKRVLRTLTDPDRKVIYYSEAGQTIDDLAKRIGFKARSWEDYKDGWAHVRDHERNDYLAIEV